MKFEKSDIKKYKEAKKEISGLKYILAVFTILSMLQTFQIEIIEGRTDYASTLWLMLLFVTLRLFVGAPDKKIFNMVEMTINSDSDNIKNSANQ